MVSTLTWLARWARAVLLVGVLLLVGVSSALELSGIRNFRAVSPRLPGVYRSAAIETASEEDCELLLKHGVTCVIDLRNADEMEKARLKATPRGRVLAEQLDAGEGRWRRIHVPVLYDMDRFFDAVEAQMPASKRVQALLYRFSSGQQLNRLLYDALSEGGNAALNTAMLAANAPDFARALNSVADCVVRGEGVLFHCAYGKDRTGVLAALLQHVAGDSPSEIVDAYGLSEQILGRQTFMAETNAEKIEGADLTNLQGSPPAAMAATLAWLTAAHGSVDNYLAKAGCADAWRARLLAAKPAAAI